MFAGRDSNTGKSHSLPDRIESLAQRAINWAMLRKKKNAQKKLAITGVCLGLWGFLLGRIWGGRGEKLGARLVCAGGRGGHAVMGAMAYRVAWMDRSVSPDMLLNPSLGVPRTPLLPLFVIAGLPLVITCLPLSRRSKMTNRKPMITKKGS